VRRADNLTTFRCRLSCNLGASTSWNPLGLSRPVMGLLYLYLTLPNSGNILPADACMWNFLGNFGELQCAPFFAFPLHLRQKVVDPPFTPSQYVLQEAIVFCLIKGKFVLFRAIKAERGNSSTVPLVLNLSSRWSTSLYRFLAGIHPSFFQYRSRLSRHPPYRGMVELQYLVDGMVS